MDVSEFNYELPQELIAQDPLEDRASSRLMVLHRKSGEIEHRTFRDIKEYLREETGNTPSHFLFRVLTGARFIPVRASQPQNPDTFINY